MILGRVKSWQQKEEEEENSLISVFRFPFQFYVADATTVLIIFSRENVASEREVTIKITIQRKRKRRGTTSWQLVKHKKLAAAHTATIHGNYSLLLNQKLALAKSFSSQSGTPPGLVNTYIWD